MTDTEELSRGEALARVAVLEAELAELRKRVCVPEGYVVVPVEPSAGHLDSMAMRMRHDFGLLPEYLKERFRGDARQLYEECTGQGLYKLPAAPAPVERNQCDGCQAGIQIENGMHRMGKPGWYPDLMACTADRYGSAPVERVEQEADCTLECGAYGSYCRCAAERATPQPAPTAAQDVAGLVEALQSIYDEDYQVGHDATDSEVSIARKQCIYRIRRKVKDALAAHQSGGAK